MNRPESVEISKKEISGSKRSMYGYILTYSRLKTGNQINSSGLRYIQTCIFVVVVITVKHTGN